MLVNTKSTIISWSVCRQASAFRRKFTGLCSNKSTSQVSITKNEDSLMSNLLSLCRYQKPISYDDDDLDNSYFRRKPTSFLSSNDSKRHTWMTPMSDDDSARLEASRVLRNNIENASGPYVVRTSYPQKSSFLSQSTEQIVG